MYRTPNEPERAGRITNVEEEELSHTEIAEAQRMKEIRLVTAERVIAGQEEGDRRDAKENK
jgi:hypothetical protein